MEQHEKYYGWHLDKRVSVGHLVTTAVVVATFVVWLMQLDGRITVLDRAIQEVVLDDARHADHADAQILRLEAKIDGQTKRLEGRMEAQYSEIIRRLEIMDQRMVEQIREVNGK